MTDPKLLVKQLRELAEENREKAEEQQIIEEDDRLRGAADAYEDAANHVEEQLVVQDTVTVATVDFAFFQAQMAHALERAVLRQEEEGDEDLDVQSVRRAHEQMLSILEKHAMEPEEGLEVEERFRENDG